jgi:anti-sigma factor RsiW
MVLAWCAVPTRPAAAGAFSWRQNRFPNMNPVSDEMLMAFADGELQPLERRAVREALTKNPLLIERLECFILTNTRIARPFRDVSAVALPEKLLRLILAS